MAQIYIFFSLIATLIAVLVYMFTQVDKWIDTQDENKKLRTEVELLTDQLDEVEYNSYILKKKLDLGKVDAYDEGWNQALNAIRHKIQSERGKRYGQDCY
jgi:Na+-translocating ferredoxin:NAD+ oxidoreductase RnfG subunit